MFSLKIHESSQGKILAACDKEILGKTFQEKVGNENICLSLTEEFYYSDFVSLETILNKLESATVANLVGKLLISELLKKDIIKKSEINQVNEVPHVQIFFLE